MLCIPIPRALHTFVHLCAAVCTSECPRARAAQGTVQNAGVTPAPPFFVDFYAFTRGRYVQVGAAVLDNDP